MKEQIELLFFEIGIVVLGLEKGSFKVKSGYLNFVLHMCVPMMEKTLKRGVLA